MATISDVEKAKRDLMDLQSEINNLSNNLTEWSGVAKNDFMKQISDINSSSNNYSVSKIINSLNKFITDYKNSAK